MSSLFLSLQGSYKQLQIALFKDKILIDSVLEESSRASAMLIPHLKAILKKNGQSLASLNFVAVDQGPGAFTSLRVMIATVNALSFATKIPVIGIDGLDALAHQTKSMTQSGAEKSYYCALLNAFNQELFFGIYDQNLNLVMPKGYKNVDLLLADIAALDAPVKLVFSGNGTKLFESKIGERFAARAHIESLEVASAEVIGLMALEQWNTKEIDFKNSHKLAPLYMKLQSYAVKT